MYEHQASVMKKQSPSILVQLYTWLKTRSTCPLQQLDSGCCSGESFRKQTRLNSFALSPISHSLASPIPFHWWCNPLCFSVTSLILYFIYWLCRCVQNCSELLKQKWLISDKCIIHWTWTKSNLAPTLVRLPRGSNYVGFLEKSRLHNMMNVIMSMHMDEISGSEVIKHFSTIVIFSHWTLSRSFWVHCYLKKNLSSYAHIISLFHMVQLLHIWNFIFPRYILLS